MNKMWAVFFLLPQMLCFTINEFSSTLTELVKKECSHSTVAQGYQNLIHKGKITLAKLEPLPNVKEYASKLNKLFLKKAEALEKVVQHVEEEASKYAWNPLLKNLSYVSLTDQGQNLTRHHYFNIPVNTSQSGVYVPSEVYINDSIIAHQVDWTSNLDHIFQQQNDTLNFIYFASEYGFLRTYPRYQWPMDDELRSLDARRKSWYTQYTGVPKDVLFLVDTSGSMHGQALHLANTSLRLLIENLNKNDFFAVAKFPSNRTHIMPSLIYGCFINGSCYNSLVQATSLNKQHVIQNVFRLTAHDAAYYDEAIAFGMKLMSTFSAGRPISAHCNKILVLISDSDISYNDSTVQILERYQDYVHLFTYSLSTITGPDYLAQVTKRINGAFAQIPVIGALSNILRHFTDHATHFGASKKLHPQKLDLVVHPAADIFPFKIAEEIGPMASLTMAVYNRTGSLSLLGIMGTDVSAREMVDLLQTYLNSPTDYAFMLDNNGFVLFHPLLKSYRKLSAQTIDIDILDIEASNVTELQTVRKNLIDNEEGVTILDDFAVFMDEVHAHRTLRTYAYTQIPETGYSICIVTATDRDLDVQYLSQKEHLDSTSGTLSIDGRNISSVLGNVNVVLSPTLANCRKPSFSRILAPPTTLTSTSTSNATSTASMANTTTTTAPMTNTTTMMMMMTNTTMTTASTTISDLMDLFSLEGLIGIGDLEDLPKVEPEAGTDASSSAVNESLFRRKRDWLTDILVNDPKGVEQIERVLRFVQEYDFGNNFYEGHFLSDLLVGLDVLGMWQKTYLSQDVIARSAFFTSGLGIIYPSHVKQDFEPLMTADFANSSIWQRVLDSHGLLFWIQPKLTEPLLPDSEETRYFTYATTPTPLTSDASNTSPAISEVTSSLSGGGGEPVATTGSSVSTGLIEEPQTGEKDSSQETTTVVDYNASTAAESEITSLNVLETYTMSSLEEIGLQTPAAAALERNPRDSHVDAEPNPDAMNGNTSPLELNDALTRSEDKGFEGSPSTSPVGSSIADCVIGDGSDKATSDCAFFTGHGMDSTASGSSGAREEEEEDQRAIVITESPPSSEGADETVMTTSTAIPDTKANTETSVSDSLLLGPVEEPLQATDSVKVTKPETTDDPAVTSTSSVTVFLGVQASQGELTNTFAVVGLTLNETYLRSLTKRFPGCEDNDVCFLLDDAAFVMAVNNERFDYQVGHFLGHVDPPLMESLLDNGVYSRVKYYDYQAVCDSAHLGEKNCTSPATRQIPSLLKAVVEFLRPRFWTSQLHRLLSIGVKLTKSFGAFSQQLLWTRPALAEENQVDYVNCVMSTYRYYATDGANFQKAGEKTRDSTAPPIKPEVSGTFSCSPECTRSWTASSIPGTNLKLVKSDRVCPCFPRRIDWQLTPSIAEDISICESASNPRYRRPIHACMT